MSSGVSHRLQHNHLESNSQNNNNNTDNVMMMNNHNSAANLTSPDSGTSSEAKPSPTSSSVLQQLSFSTIPQVLIAPKEQVTYEKQTQTTSTQSTSSNDRGLFFH